MNITYVAIEQLDLSARQLWLATPSFDRFSLILSDNIVELMLCEQCRAEFCRDKGWNSYGHWWGGRNQYSQAVQADVLGKHFDKRLKFCRNRDIISDRESDFISVLHSYRNEVYHAGIRHDDVLHVLAWQYHEFACDLFARICPIDRSYTIGEKLSDAVAKHLPGGPESVDTALAGDSLKATKPGLCLPFAKALSEAILRRIEEFSSGLWYIAEEDVAKEAQALREAQLHVHLYGDHSQFTEELAQISDIAEYSALVEKISEEWRPVYAENPAPRFNARAKLLGSEASPLIAVKKFQKLCDDIEPIANVIAEVARLKDNREQMELDCHRGK